MNAKPKVYQNECPICGTVFESRRPNAKYCERHRKNGTRKLAQIEAKQRHQRYEEDNHKLITFNCDYCGREHIVERYLVSRLTISEVANTNWDGNTHRYCCIEHKEQDRHDHQTCSNCGKSLKGSTYPYSVFRQYNYCSEACEREHKEKLKANLGKLFTCQYCGKTFQRQYGDVHYFCSRACSTAARKSGWESPTTKQRKAREESEKVTVKFKCSVCGNIYEKTFRNKIDAEMATRSQHFLCTDECKSKFWERAKKERREAKQLAKEKKNARKPDEPLCASCRVSYKDCERMQSDFRVLPKGAHYNDKGVLVECPKYK